MLGRYTTGPSAARPDYSRGRVPCQSRRRVAAAGPGALSRPVVPSLDRGLTYTRDPMPDQPIDLRSDTVTHPSPEMRRAMAEAEVGDDVFGDDPTVIALEERAAELTGKEAALFVASGTMGNLVSVLAQVPRGGEIIAGEGNHTFAHEAANHAVVVGAGMKLLPWNEQGQMDLDDIRSAFRNPMDVHEPLTSLVMLENTHSDSMAQP